MPAHDKNHLNTLIGGRLILADGSTGTALESLAPEAAASGRIALLPLERPDIIENLHTSYLKAGSELVETATFSASVRDMAHFSDELKLDAEKLCYKVNLAAAAAAARAVKRFHAECGRIAFVAGSIGPGDAPPSLGSSTYSELLDSYLPQARGLAEGGADLAIIETCQDPLQIKAAIAALKSPEGGNDLPFIVSPTVDGRGRMLAVSDIAALIAIIQPFNPLAIGLNCSGGPDELADSLEELAALSPFPLCFMPNAGLPSSIDGRTTYPFGPELFAEKVETLARRFGLAIVGGCCGTTPAHIAALHARLVDRPRASTRPKPRPALASLYSARYFGPDLFRIGERANTAGSAAFAKLLDAENFEGMADKALMQEGSGASAIDIHVSRPGRDESADLEKLAALLSQRAQAALCLDSSSPDALARALALIGGRPLINSTSLEDPEKTRKVFALASEFGAAVVCLAMDACGPARDIADKVKICRSLYEIATREFRLSPMDLLFDPLTFTVAAGGDVASTIDSIEAIKKACPGSLTVLGVGNVSYGLPKIVRPAVTSLFTQAAVKAGLDSAIIDTTGIPKPESLDPVLGAAALRALGLGQTREESDSLDELLAWAAEHGQDKRSAAAPTDPTPASGLPADTSSLLSAALMRGDSAESEIAGKLLLQEGGPNLLSSVVTAAMTESGRLWNDGLLSLPLVLRTAEAARRALSSLAASTGSAAKDVVIMATVKGDLHDIGKNIVSAILACSGRRIVDLGTNVQAAAIIDAAREHGAVAIGLSGLLTRSLAEMKGICETLHSLNMNIPVLCGGAAIEPAFVAREMEPMHPGLVRACADAFEATTVLDEYAQARSTISSVTSKSPSRAAPDTQKSAGSPIIPRQEPAFEAPFLGTSPPIDIPFQELLGYLDKKTLFSSRWGYRQKDFPLAKKALEEVLHEAKSLASIRAVYGYFNCRRAEGNTLVIDIPARNGQDSIKKTFDLPFPAEADGHKRSISTYFSTERDAVAFFCVTVGPGIAEAARDLKRQDRLEDYWRLHGLGSALAEAGAALIHDRIAEELAMAGVKTRGRRYSFGFPACPGVEYQGALLELLEASRIGLSVTSGHQLNPEHSVTAFIVARPDAIYFTT